MNWQKKGETKGAVVNLKKFGGAVAQLGARLDGIEEVVGSNPIGSTNHLRFWRGLNGRICVVVCVVTTP